MDPNEESSSSATTRLDTKALLERVRDGDGRAVELLFERHYARVHRIVRVRLWGAAAQREQIEDVVQRVMTRAFCDLDDFEPREDARFVDWLARLAENEIKNLRRHHEASKRDASREVALEDLRPARGSECQEFEPRADSTGVLDRLSRRELEDLVDRCLAEFKGDAREVILLRDYAGGSWSWIAETLGRPSGDAARKLYARSLATLGVELRRRVGDVLDG